MSWSCRRSRLLAMTQKAPGFVRAVPAGDDRERLVCNDCGFVNYENPKIVVLEPQGARIRTRALPKSGWEGAK